MKLVSILALCLLMLGCSQIQRYETVSKTIGTQQTAAIGSELYRVNKTRDLPNAFGKADVWGGKVNEGYSELRFMGLTNDGKIIFRLTDIDIESNESVFTRYGTSRSTINSNTTANASVYGNTAYGSANTNTTVSHYEKPEATITQLPPNTIEFVFDPSDKMLPLEGITIEVLQVKTYSISYVLHKNN
ncbi:hypothetical protein [uncultured Neptuniibacter sp.]|uniref:hypothetical protein n=1 Tax=uncultured Neptuniibacter sp. TaxID=502143 RepID=UPI002622BB7D|nr:hypothetical protein [uncultured Neptuniibacter sp.]